MKIKLTLLLILAVLSCVSDLRAEDEGNSTSWEYSLGHGLRVADSNIHIGGYANIDYSYDTEDDTRFRVEHLSLFVFGDLGHRWKFFSEFEVEEFWQVNSGLETRSDSEGEIERFYVEYLQSDSFRVRVGKFLTPVGIWNEIHAAPLTWTVSRPLNTYMIFPEFVTGLQVSGDVTMAEQDLSYSLYLQNNETIDERTSFIESELLYGARLRWFRLPNQGIGVPLLYYEDYNTGDKSYLSGLDFQFKKGPVEMSGEGTYSIVDLEEGNLTREYGYYLQGVYGVTERTFAVLRHDYMRGRDDIGTHEAWSIGCVFRFKPQISFKAEYQTRNGSMQTKEVNDSERFLASASILF